MNNKKLVVIGLIVAVVAIILLSLASSRQNTSITILGSKVSVPAGFAATAKPFTKDTVVFSNARSLSTYNYKTGESKSLTPYRAGKNLGYLDSLSVSKNNKYILFHLERTEAGGILDEILMQRKLDTAKDYWWVYEVSSQQFNPLPAGTLLAKIDDARVYGLSKNGTTESLATYAVADLKKQSTINIPGSSDFYPIQNGFLLETPNKEILSTKNGVVSTTLLSSASIIGVADDGQTVIAVVETKNASESDVDRKLISFPLNKPASQATISTEILGQPLLNRDGTRVLYRTAVASSASETENQATITNYAMSSKQSVLWRIPGATAKGAAVANTVTMLDSDTAIVSEEGTKMFIVGNGLKTISAADATYSRIIQVNQTPVTITYDNYQSSFLAFPILPDLAGQQAAIEQTLRSNGINPDLYPIVIDDVIGD